MTRDNCFSALAGESAAAPREEDPTMTLALVVPCYNEQEALPETNRQLLSLLREMREGHEVDDFLILYVDDGSRDRTWAEIASMAAGSPHVHGLRLAHNSGHQRALWAGLEWAVDRADAVVTIDADLQDDIQAIPRMARLYREGRDIVYGARRSRATDSPFKRATARAFYGLLRAMGAELVFNHADFRLMSRRSLRALLSFPERNLFLRGLVPTLGFPSAVVYYDRLPRQAGKTKYPLSKMLALAMDGITSFSTRPLRCISCLGLLLMLASLGGIVYGVCSWAAGRALPGWTSLLVSLWFIGGAVLLACGIIGEYVGKTYQEVKRRPRYFIEAETPAAPLPPGPRGH